ncbi:MAG: hypothetical protein PHD32_08355 [Eubacteriales bacterium]|nr:hypothetical protein [Eubacteriales bacterium]
MTKKRRKKYFWRIALPCLAVLCVGLVLADPWVFSRLATRFPRWEYVLHREYGQAHKQLTLGEYEQAARSFSALIPYRDAEKQAADAWAALAEQSLRSENYDEAVRVYGQLGDARGEKAARIAWGDALLRQGKPREALAQWEPFADDETVAARLPAARLALARALKDAGQAQEAYALLFSLREDGEAAKALWELCTADLSRAETAAFSQRHLARLRADGTALAYGDNDKGQCRVDTWQGVVSLAAGERHTAGLRWDGTVLAAGDNGMGQCEVSAWHDVLQIAACGDATLGLRADATVACAGGTPSFAEAVSAWKNVAWLSAGEDHAAAVTAAGDVLTAGSTAYGQWNTGGLPAAARVYCGPHRTLVVLKDGSCRLLGLDGGIKKEVEAWRGITRASLALSHAAAITDAGVQSAGDDLRGRCRVSGWDPNTLCGLYTIRTATIALTANGKLLTTAPEGNLPWEDTLVWRFPQDS